MANLLGRLKGNRKEVTRLGHRDISATLETWDGQIRVDLKENGDFYVYVEEKGGHGAGRAAAMGNVNEDQRHLIRVPTREEQEV